MKRCSWLVAKQANETSCAFLDIDLTFTTSTVHAHGTRSQKRFIAKDCQRPTKRAEIEQSRAEGDNVSHARDFPHQIHRNTQRVDALRITRSGKKRFACLRGACRRWCGVFGAAFAAAFFSQEAIQVNRARCILQVHVVNDVNVCFGHRPVLF